MRQILHDKKQERKRILLAAWDDAITHQETDRSLDILKELDQYLTPNEALALQEAASDVFRTKLHNLGVQFSIAVTEKRWADTLDIAQNIINDFPNSRMSKEILAKLDVLKQNVQMQNNEKCLLNLQLLKIEQRLSLNHCHLIRISSKCMDV